MNKNNYLYLLYNMEQVGIKSIVDRLKSLEQEVKHDEAETFESKILNNLEKQRKDYKTSELQKIKNHYIAGSDYNKLSSYDIFTLIEYTVRYIEANIHKIAMLLSTTVTSELKLQTAISLIRDIVSDFSDEFLANSINGIVKLIFNSDMKKLKPTEVKTVDVKKKKVRFNCDII